MTRNTKKGIAIGMMIALGSGFMTYQLSNPNTMVKVFFSKFTNELSNDTIKERKQHVASIEKFLREMNSASLLEVDGTPIMFTYEEAEALMIYLNNWNKTEFYHLFGDTYNLNQTDVRDAYESALLKLRLYNVKSQDTPNIGIIINDTASREFLNTYIELNALYNYKDTYEEKQEVARIIIEQLEKDFIEGSNAPYTKVNPGVARMVITSYEKAWQIGWCNSKVRIPNDLEKVLQDTIAAGLCGETNDNVEYLVGELDNIQIVILSDGKHKKESEKTSYLTLKEKAIDRLIEIGAYPLHDIPSLDADNPGYFTNYNSKPITHSNTGKSSTTTVTKVAPVQTSGGQNVPSHTGHDLDPNQVIDQVQDVAPGLVDEAQKQLEEDQNYRDGLNADEERYKEGFEDGFNENYEDFLEDVRHDRKLPKPLPVIHKRTYPAGYNDGSNKALEAAKDYKRDRDREIREIEDEEPEVTYDYSTPVQPQSQPSNCNDNSTETNTEVDIDLNQPVDGEIYDENHNVVDISSVVPRSDYIQMLYTYRNSLQELLGPSKTYKA